MNTPDQQLIPDEPSDKAAYEYEQGKQSRQAALLDEYLDDERMLFESFVGIEGAEASFKALMTVCGQGKKEEAFIFCMSIYNRVCADLNESAELRSR